VSFIYNDRANKKPRSSASRRVLCGGCRMVYVMQQDGERARCIICKKDPTITYHERRDND